MKTTITLLFLSLCLLSKAQINPLSTDYKIEHSNFIVEGEIIDENTYKTETSIYTNYTLKVFNVLKGTLKTNTIVIKSIGGTVGNEKLIVCPSNNFSANNKGIYYLNRLEDDFVFEATFFGQSEYRLDFPLNANQVYSIKKEESALKTVLNSLKNSNKANNNLAVTISNISPASVNAGVGETITITGTGFGATGPSGAVKVWTRFANNPSSMVSHANVYNYLSWSDTQIVFKVPSRAGTGQIWVGSGSSHATSSQVLTVQSNIRDNVVPNNSAILPVNLPALQGLGILFTPNINFTNVNAITRTNEAMLSWFCETGIDMSLDISTTTTNTNNTNDGLSVIYFDNTMSASTLGVTLTQLSACSSSGRWYVKDVDLAINGNTNFNFTLGSTAASEIDYYSVVLHELGHVRNLGHVLNANHVMYPSISGGQEVRTLHPNDIIGGNLVQNDSNTNQVCGKPLMVAVSCPPLSVDDNVFVNVTVFPNPAIDYISFSGLKNNKNYQYTIFDLNGKQLITNNTKSDRKINVSALSSGMYFIKVNHIKPIKFIKK